MLRTYLISGTSDMYFAEHFTSVSSCVSFMVAKRHLETVADKCDGLRVIERPRKPQNLNLEP